MLSCTWFLIVSKKIFVGDERNTYSKCSMVYISREKEGKKIADEERTICQNRLLVEMRLIMIYGEVLPDERIRYVL